jgi:hypothetical protein
MLERTDEYAKPVQVTDEERLQAFYEKSKHLTPRCLGGYDKDDEICTKYCACGRTEFDSHDDNSRKVLNEPTGMGINSFFYSRKTVPACRQEAARIEKAIRDAEERLRRVTSERMSRGYYIEHLRRIPVGQVRYGKRVKNFVAEEFIHIGTKGDERYLYKVVPYDGPLYNTSERRLASILDIRGRRNPTGDYIKVLTQDVQADTVILTVKSAREESRQVYGHKFRIFLKLEDALDSHVQMDDLGSLE